MPNHWIVVAGADHVRCGVAGGFVQACHGKVGPLKRMKPGDQVFCYSPVRAVGGRDLLQMFTAMGMIADASPYVVEGANAFRPYRREVVWTRTGTAPIRPLLDKLELTAGLRNWGMPFRSGLVQISPRDAALIALALSLSSARPRLAETPRTETAKRLWLPVMRAA